MNYSTPNQGLAAFLLTQEQKLVDIEKRKSKVYDGDSYFFVFDTQVQQGHELASSFFEKKTSVEPNQYWESMKELRAALRDTRAKETN